LLIGFIFLIGKIDAESGAKVKAKNQMPCFGPLTTPSPRRKTRIMIIYKIFRGPEWRALKSAGHTAGAPVDLADGFIHFSTGPQVAQTAARHFQGQNDLWLAALNSDQLGPELKWEPSRGGALFPHLYRVLLMSDVLWCRQLPLGSAGHFFPKGVLCD
jgi:uncharacterized protein (DUF952 family)